MNSKYKSPTIFLVIVLLLLLLLFIFNNNSFIFIKKNGNENALNTIDIYEWKKIYEENKENPDYVILDVRTPREFKSGYIQGAVNINFYDVNFKNELNKLDKNKKYLIYCRSGSRSGRTLEIMRELGFKNVFDLEGGILNWNRKGFSLAR